MTSEPIIPARPSRAYLRVRLTLRHDARIKHLGRSLLVAQATGAGMEACEVLFFHAVRRGKVDVAS
jgi:hypothetical protein